MNIKHDNLSGDNIVHQLAQTLDIDRLKNEILLNKDKILSMVNVPNNDGKFPIHIALDATNRFKKDYSFVTYLINDLHAKTNVPDPHGRIIVDNYNSISKMDANLNKLNKKIIENIRDLSNKTNLNNIKSSNITDMSIAQAEQITFVRELIESYQYNDAMKGGYNGRRFIQKYSNESSDDVDTSDSFLSGDKYVDKYTADFPMERPRPKPDAKSSERYKKILSKIMELTKKNEEDAKTLRSFIKLTLTDKDPTLKKIENDDKKTKMIEEIVDTKKSLDEFIKKYLPESTQKELKKRMDEQKRLAEERRKKYDNSSDLEKSSKTKKEKESKATKNELKRKNKYLNSEGYLQSTEIILSSE